MSLLDDFDDALEWGSNDDPLLGPDAPVDWSQAVSPEASDPGSPSMTTPG